MQTNLHFTVTLEDYCKLHAFAKKDRRRYVNTLKLGLSLSAEKKQTSRPPSKGTPSNLPLRGWISPSNPHPLPALPPPSHGVYIDRCIRLINLTNYHQFSNQGTKRYRLTLPIDSPNMYLERNTTFQNISCRLVKHERSKFLCL